jgi:hypothetical protein
METTVSGAGSQLTIAGDGPTVLEALLFQQVLPLAGTRM